MINLCWTVEKDYTGKLLNFYKFLYRKYKKLLQIFLKFKYFINKVGSYFGSTEKKNIESYYGWTEKKIGWGPINFGLEKKGPKVGSKVWFFFIFSRYLKF